ncbi:hypothetical protein QWY16_16430 [Planococcus shenhongbingii]|uniref:Uncharacterized protein n=1 Tax=Planococcus shenhongbingii TaxID=3058398 RepID=A0ABT8NAQ6_9BACL|nr:MULTISPECIES: hypothetical protein [unclassified Planococcus (in: firmicutes)]MDN7244967.1 hypothetical protein [Planococcus sp. N017]WKA58067.1 hypothetical protein QWY16_16430 [Planococcus sp. N016]
MKEFKITYFFDEEHYIRRFIHVESQEKAEALIHSERDQYISFTDSRGIYHELHTGNVRVIQLSEYFRVDKSKTKKAAFD